MPTPKPIQAVIKKVVPNPGGKSWDVFLAPYEDLWLTVHQDEVERDPKPGDTLTIMPPHVLAHQPQARACPTRGNHGPN